MLLVLVVLLGIVGVIGYTKLNSQYGITTAELVSHEALAGPNTRLRAVVKPRKILSLIERNLPLAMLNDLPVPSIARSYIPSIISRAIPNEVAILGGADFPK